MTKWNCEMNRLATDAARNRVAELLGRADILVNGSRPWDLQVNRESFFSRVVAEGSLGFGDSYVEGWWDCEAIDQMIEKVWRAGLPDQIRVWRDLPLVLRARFFNLQRGNRAFQVGSHHYDKGNDFYGRMLDSRMIYSCGYWAEAETLDQAQEDKLELICRKLQLEPGMRVLDIGCGWGGAARFAAERYGVKVTGLTVSKEQAAFARDLNRGLPVEIRLSDYGELREKFDRIFSIGMFEHVGYRSYEKYFEVVRRCLSRDGIFLLHTIGSLVTSTTTDPWIEQRIFPNSLLPSARQIVTAAEGQMVMEDWHNFGADYDQTLTCWHRNIEEAWDDLDPGRYDEKFRRMWRYYLLGCAGGFRAREMQLWQMVFSAEGISGGYRARGIR